MAFFTASLELGRRGLGHGRRELANEVVTVARQSAPPLGRPPAAGGSSVVEQRRRHSTICPVTLYLGCDVSVVRGNRHTSGAVVGDRNVVTTVDSAFGLAVMRSQPSVEK